MKKARILVVDDEESLVEFLELLLRGEGYDVTTASSVKGAVEALERRAIDLVLCDLHMPGGSGLDLLGHLREQGLGPAVIVMTAYTSTESAIEAMKLGAYDYVSKPFDVEELKLLVQRALERPALRPRTNGFVASSSNAGPTATSSGVAGRCSTSFR